MNIPWTCHEYEWIHHPKWRSPHFVRHLFPFTWSSSSQHRQLQNWWTSGVHHWGATAFIQKPHPLVPKSIGFEPQTCDEYSFHSARPDGNELKRQVDDKKRISMDIPASSTQGDRFLFSFICFRLHKQFNDVGVVACNFQDLFNKTFTVMLCTLGSSLTHRNAVSPMSPFSKRNQKLSTLFFLNNTRRSPVPLLMTYSPGNSHHSIEQGDKISGPKCTKDRTKDWCVCSSKKYIYSNLLCRSNLDNHLRLLVFSILCFKLHTSRNGAEFHPSKV